MVCLSESLMEYKKENFEEKEEDNEDDLDLKNEINKYTMNILDKRKGDFLKSMDEQR